MAQTGRTDLPDGESEKFFERGLDRQAGDLPVGQILAAPRWVSQAQPILRGLVGY
jgi:hypothetical protein